MHFHLGGGTTQCWISKMTGFWEVWKYWCPWLSHCDVVVQSQQKPFQMRVMTNASDGQFQSITIHSYLTKARYTSVACDGPSLLNKEVLSNLQTHDWQSYLRNTLSIMPKKQSAHKHTINFSHVKWHKHSYAQLMRFYWRYQLTRSPSRYIVNCAKRKTSTLCTHIQ